MPLSEGKIVERLTELMKLDGMAGSHIRVLSNLRSFYVAKYITRFREVHRLFPLPNWIYLLADPGDWRPHDTEVFEFDGPGLGDDATFPAHRQQGNCMAHEHEAMDEDVASQGPDSTQDEIHHDQEMDLTSNDALGEVDPEIISVVDNGPVGESGNTKGAMDGLRTSRLNTVGANKDKPLFIPESNPPSDDDTPLWDSTSHLRRSSMSPPNMSSSLSSPHTAPGNPRPSPDASTLGILGQKRSCSQSKTGDSTRNNRPRLDSSSLASSDSEDLSSASEEGETDLPKPTFGRIRQPRDKTPPEGDDEDSSGSNPLGSSPNTLAENTPHPSAAPTAPVPSGSTSSNPAVALSNPGAVSTGSTPPVPSRTTSRSKDFSDCTSGNLSTSLTAGAPIDGPAGTGTILGGVGPGLTASTTSTGPSGTGAKGPTGATAVTGPSGGPVAPGPNQRASSTGGSPVTAGRGTTSGTAGAGPTAGGVVAGPTHGQVALREASPVT
ncbi:hypothetical protein PGTUg99_036997 [Puccinia graminis f. sp. tritici]|uniref:Uncharacterized protein n=1 Tax=Puccinia graminis f. sp. tritici TaxID=56615 RepID=A0A5B0QVB1_PUCGR|nr:hypothetical protein PGTUg99_036997 [Puccinia graminis f. sp. tritici]